MSAFDPKAYKDVLKEYSKGDKKDQLSEVIRELKADPASRGYLRLDLPTLLGVSLPASASELASWSTSLTPALNKAAGSLPAARLVKELLDGIAAQGNTLTEPAFWESLDRDRQQSVRRALEQAIAQLTPEYPLGVASEASFIQRLESLGVAGISPKAVRAAAEKQGLTLAEAIDLPSGDLPGSIRGVWKAVSAHPEYASMADLVLLHRPQDRRDVTFLSTLSANGSPVTAEDLEKARHQSEKGQDTNALQDAQKFLGVLKSEASSTEQLRLLLLSSLVARVEYDVRRGRPKVAIRDQLVKDGFEAQESARLVEAVSATAAAAGPKLTLDSVRERLAQGELEEAGRLLEAIQPEADEAAEHARLTAKVAGDRQRREELVREYTSALARRDLSAASIALEAAAALDAADERWERLRAAIPPSSPAGFSARADGARVRLSWARGADPEVSFTVVRARGQAPASVSAGDAVVPSTKEDRAEDQRPPVAEEVFYSLFATRDGRQFSDPAAVSITVLPEPQELQASTGESSATIRWTSAREAVGTEAVWTGPGGQRQAQTVQGTSLTVDGLQLGSAYRFALRSVYLVNGRTEHSAAAEITATPRGTARAVNDLDITPQASGAFRGQWTPVPGFVVEVWRFPPHADLPAGQAVSLSQLRSLGGGPLSPLSVAATPGTLEFAAPQGVLKAAPVTLVSGDEAILGGPVLTGTVPGVTSAVAEEFGGELRLSWVWPEGDHRVEVAWTENGARRSRRVTRARYQADGGFRLPRIEGVSDVTVAAIAMVDADELASPAVPVPLPERGSLPEIRYTVALKKSLFSGVTCTVTTTTDQPGVSATADLVLKRGSIMPYAASDGQVIETLLLDHTSSTSSTHQVSLGKQASPYWVCLFLREPAACELLPPSTTSQMKG